MHVLVLASHATLETAAVTFKTRSGSIGIVMLALETEQFRQQKADLAVIVVLEPTHMFSGLQSG